MEKPGITKQLAFIAMLFVCANFFLNVIAILFPGLYIRLFTMNLEPELPVRIQAILLARAACVLPLGGVCYWSWQQSDISENQANGTLVFTVVSYLIRVIGMALLGFLLPRMVGSAVEAAVCNYIGIAQSFFGFCITAALVLICCAASIELYITKSITSKS